MTVLRAEFPDHSSPFSRDQERKRKQAAIVSAAAELFDRDGMRATRLEDVAAQLGLTKTSIGYYYASKEDLAAEVFRASCTFLDDAIASAKAHDGDPADRILNLLSTYADQWAAVAAGRRVRVAAVNELNALRPALRDEIAERLSRSVAAVDTLTVEWLQASGSQFGRSEPMTFLIFGLLDWMGRWLPHQGLADARTAVSALLDLVEHGLIRERPWAPTELSTAPGDDTMVAPQIFDREARNSMKREAFLKVGVRFFNERGFGGVALSEIASALGVTRGAFYYHIPDKEQLLEQCLDRSFLTVEAALDRAERAGGGGLAIVERTLRDLIYQQASGVAHLLRPSLSAALPKARQRRYDARMRSIAQRLGDALTAAVGDESARDMDIDTIEQVLTSTLFLNGGYTIDAANSFTNWRMSEDPLTAAVDYAHILMAGLRGTR